MEIVHDLVTTDNVDALIVVVPVTVWLRDSFLRIKKKGRDPSTQLESVNTYLDMQEEEEEVPATT